MDLRNESINQPLSVNSDGIVKVDLKEKSAMTPSQESEATRPVSRWWTTDHIRAVLNSCAVDETSPIDVYNIIDCPAEWRDAFGTRVLRLLFKTDCFTAAVPAMPLSWPRYTGEVKTFPLLVPNLLALLTHLDHPDVLPLETDPKIVAAACHPMVQTVILDVYRNIKKPDGLLENVVRASEEVVKLSGAAASALEQTAAQASAVSEVVQAAGKDLAGAASTGRKVLEQLKEYLEKISAGVSAAFNWSSENVIALLKSPCELVKTIFDWLKNRCSNWIGCLGALLKNPEFYGLLSVALLGLVSFTLVWGAQSPPFLRILVGFAAAADLAYCGISCFNMISDLMIACPQDRFQALASDVWNILLKVATPIGKMAQSAGINSIWQFFMGVVRAKDGIAWTWNAALDFFRGFVNTVSEALGIKDFIYFHSISPVLEEWMKKAHDFVTAAVQKRVGSSDLVALRVLHSEGSQLAGAGGCRLPETVKRPFMDLLNEIRRVIGAARPIGAFHKMQPFLTLFTGDPGLGKTVAVLQSIVMMLMRPGVFSQEIRDLWKKDPSAVLFTFAPEIRYDTGLKRQVVGIIDEWLASVNPSDPASEWLRILRMCNELVSPTEQAAIEDKGQVNEMEAVFVTSNTKVINAAGILRDPRAPVRRCDLIVKVLPNEEDGYYYNASLGRIVQSDENGKLTPLEPSEGYNMFNTNCLRFGIAKGEIVYKGRKVTCTLGNDFAIPDDYVYKVTFAELVDIIARGIIRNREKFGSADDDLKTTARVVEEMYFGDVIDDSVPQAEVQKFDLDAARFVLALALKLEPKFPNARARLLRLSQNRLFRIWQLSYAPRVMEQTAAEFLQLQAGEEEALVGTFSEKVVQLLERKFNALVLTFHSFRTTAVSFLKRFGWLIGIVLGVAGLGVGVYLAWDWIKSVVPSAIISMFSVVPQAVNYLGNVGATDVVAELAKSRKQGYDKGLDDALPLLTRNEWAVIAQEDKKGHAGQNPDFIAKLFCVRGRQYLCTKHVYDRWVDLGYASRKTLVRLVRVMEPAKPIEVDLCEVLNTMEPVEDNDEHVWLWMPSVVPSCYDMTHFLFPKALLASWVGPQFQFECHPVRQDPKTGALERHHFYGLGLQTSKIRIQSRPVYAFAYPMATQTGDCMTPIYVNNPRVPTSRVLGFHVAGSPNTGFACYVSKEAAQSKPFDKLGKGVRSVHNAKPQAHLERQDTISGNMSHYVLDVQPRINRKHELVPSPLSGFTNAIRGLPAMFPVDGKDPYLNQNAKVLRPRPLGDLALLKACARSYFHNVLGRLPVTVPPVSMLTQTQVLKGDPSYHLAALGKDHYAGFMWREGFQGTPKEEAYVKKYASRFPYLGREGDHPLDPELLYLIETAVKRDYAAASQDEALCEPIKRDLKSELRSETPASVLDHYKFVPFSTTRYPEDSQRSYKPPRFIAAFGLPHQWRVKQCFGSFLAHFLNTRLWAMHTLGINVAGSEADTLARLLHRLRLIETDFAECDYSLLGCLSEEIVHNVEETFFKQAPDWHPDHARYRKAIAVEIFHSLYIMMEDGKYKAFSSDCNGTGSGLTAFMTTAQAIILGMYSAARILERRNISTVDFLNNPCTYLRSVYNGDDSIAAFTEKFPQFPAPEFALGFKEWGCDAVDPISKVATTLEFKSLTGVSFLKRHFRWHDVAQRWVLAMSFDVIHDLPLFVLRGGDALSQCMVRCDLGIMEAAAHDRLTYDMVAEYYEYLWRCFGKTFISPPYESAFRSRCALEDKVGVRPADDPLDVEPQSDTQRLQFVQANANVDANTPKGVEVVERSVAKAPSNPPNSIFRLMQSPILCATGSLTNTTAKGRVTTLGPFQTLYNNSSEFAALLEQYQSFSGRIRFTWQFTANYKNMGRVALRVDPRGPYQRLASNTIPATWQQNADAISRLPGAYAYLADTNFLFVDVDFISTQSFFQLNSDLDTISSKGPDVVLSVEGSLNGGIAQTYPYVILCTLLELKMGPVAPLAGSTPATPLQIQPQSDLLRAGAAAAEATGTIMDKIAGVAANATAAFPIAAEVGAGVAVAAKTGAMLAKPVSSVLSTFADAAGALGFTHDPPGIMYTQQNPSANQFNSNGPMFYQDLHMTHGYGTAPPMDADLSETNVAVLGSKYNIYSDKEMLLQPVASTPTGTVLGSVYVNPQANDASAAAGGRTYYPSPSGAFFASSKFGRWGVETIKVRLGNCGPKLVAGKIRAVFYSYSLEQSGGAPTFAYKLSEAAPHKDWDLSVSRETELEFDVPMNVSMVPMNVNMGQVDFIVLSPLATNVGDVTQVPICVEVAFGGLRVGWLRDADVVPLLASLISDGISCDAVPQADTSTLERVAAHLSAGPPTKADVPARSMELCLDLLSVLKIAHQVYTLPTSGTNYIIVYPPALQCANVVSGSYVGGGSFISACLLAYAFWQGDFILGTYSLRAPTIGNMGNVYMYDPLVYCQAFTATAMQTFVSTAAFGTPTVRTAPINNYSNMVRVPMDSSVAWLPSIPSDPLGTTPITIQNDSMGAACVITPPTATAGTYLWPSWAKSLTMQAADMRVKMYCGAPPLVLLSSALANVGLLKARRVRGAPSLDDERPLALKRGAEQRKGVNHASLALSGLGSGRNV